MYIVVLLHSCLDGPSKYEKLFSTIIACPQYLINSTQMTKMLVTKSQWLQWLNRPKCCPIPNQILAQHIIQQNMFSLMMTKNCFKWLGDSNTSMFMTKRTKLGTCGVALLTTQILIPKNKNDKIHDNQKGVPYSLYLACCKEIIIAAQLTSIGHSYTSISSNWCSNLSSNVNESTICVCTFIFCHLTLHYLQMSYDLLQQVRSTFFSQKGKFYWSKKTQNGDSPVE